MLGSSLFGMIESIPLGFLQFMLYFIGQYVVFFWHPSLKNIGYFSDSLISSVHVGWNTTNLMLSFILTACNYHTFSNISQLDYKSNIRFSFENLSKIENSYISRVEKKRNLAKYVKNEILPRRKKKNLASWHITKRAKMFSVCKSFWGKKKCLNHPYSNETAHAGCLTN